MVLCLPAEVVYDILDHLWGDPWTLFNCAFTCRTWQDASRRLLRRWDGLQILDFDNLDRVSRPVNFKKTRHFYRNINQLYITDNEEKPFVHRLPVTSSRHPVSQCTNSPTIAHRMGQSQATQHVLLPHHRVRVRHQPWCLEKPLRIFSRPSQVRDGRVRNVSTLGLYAIHVSSPLILGPKYWNPSKASLSSATVKRLCLEALHFNSTVPVYSSKTAQPDLLNPILAFRLCATFTSVTIVHIRRCIFRCHDDLHHFIQSFARLRDVTIAQVYCDVLGTHRFVTPRANNVLAMPELEKLTANVGSPPEGDKLLDWLATIQSLHKLRTLLVSLCNTSVVGRTLRAIGHNLDRLSFQTAASMSE